MEQLSLPNVYLTPAEQATHAGYEAALTLQAGLYAQLRVANDVVARFEKRLGVNTFGVDFGAITTDELLERSRRAIDALRALVVHV